MGVLHVRSRAVFEVAEVVAVTTTALQEIVETDILEVVVQSAGAQVVVVTLEVLQASVAEACHLAVVADLLEVDIRHNPGTAQVPVVLAVCHNTLAAAVKVATFVAADLASLRLAQAAKKIFSYSELTFTKLSLDKRNWPSNSTR